MQLTRNYTYYQNKDPHIALLSPLRRFSSRPSFELYRERWSAFFATAMSYISNRPPAISLILSSPKKVHRKRTVLDIFYTSRTNYSVDLPTDIRPLIITEPRHLCVNYVTLVGAALCNCLNLSKDAPKDFFIFTTNHPYYFCAASFFSSLANLHSRIYVHSGTRSPQ